MEFTRIILRPIHTEKVYVLNNLPNKKFAFEVDIKATKQDIAIAFESIYNIKPTKVATQIRKPAKVRTGTAHPGYTKLMKLAYITLPEGTTIAANAEEAKVENKAAKKEAAVHKDVTKKEVAKKTTKVETTKSTATKKEVTKVDPKVVREVYKELEKDAGLPDDKKGGK
jgi:large subunit ribosomal protein L23